MYPTEQQRINGFWEEEKNGEGEKPYTAQKHPGFCSQQKRGRDSSCVNFLTEIAPGTALAVFAFRGSARSNKNIAPGFSLSRNTKQLVLLPFSEN